MAKTTRHLGYCPCCAKTFKVRSNTLVHHGYKRPGYGFIVGDCFGALETPHELSDGLAKRFLKLIEKMLAGDQEALAEIDTLTELTVKVRDGYQGCLTIYKDVKVPKVTAPEGGYDWDNDREGSLALHKAVEAWNKAYSRRTNEIKSSIRCLKREVKRLTDLVDTWKLTPLTTVEEEEAAKRDAKAVREAKKVAKKAEKVAAQVAKYQKRIDSALRTKNSNTLADIWGSCQRKLRDIDDSLTKAACIALLGRDEVWEAFGLDGLEMAGYWDADGEAKVALKRMENRMDRLNGSYSNIFKPFDEWEVRRLNEMTLEWPETLGGENKKGIKTLAELRERVTAPSLRERIAAEKASNSES